MARGVERRLHRGQPARVIGERIPGDDDGVGVEDVGDSRDRLAKGPGSFVDQLTAQPRGVGPIVVESRPPDRLTQHGGADDALQPDSRSG